MPILIDGHNLIGQMPDMSLSDPADEDKLVSRLHALAELTHKRITVVFDPNPLDNAPSIGQGRSHYGKLTVIFAPTGSKADDIIRHMVSDVKDKQGMLVVTSDMAVVGFTRQCGIRVQSSRDFVRWLNAQKTSELNPDRKPHSSSQEVVNWAEVFTEPVTQAVPKPVSAAVRNRKKGKKSEQLKEQIKKVRPLF